MNVHDAAEQAYRNGYAKGYADAKKNEKHGRWEDIYSGKYANPRYRCSHCKQKALYVAVQTMLGTWRDEQDLSNYCPNCGAKMDLPNITENTRKALEKMGENVHSEIDFDYAAEDE